MHLECAADNEMCIYCLGLNNYLSFLFFYIFVTVRFTNVVLKESYLAQQNLKILKILFLIEIWIIYL